MLERYLAACALLGTAMLPAQEQPASPTEAGALYRRIVDDLHAAQREHDLAMRRLERTEAYEAAMAAYREAARSRDRDGLAKARARLDELRKTVPAVDLQAFLDRMKEAAARFRGTEDAVDFLIWIVKNGRIDPQAAKEAAKELLERHVESPRLVALAQDLFWLFWAGSGLGMEGARRLADELVRKSPHDMVRAWALYWRGFAVQRDRRASARARSQAERDLAEARKLAEEGSLLALRLDAPRFEREHLQIGKVAPDIEGEDLDGVPFKLSDYRGKVVVLDFWGDW